MTTLNESIANLINYLLSIGFRVIVIGSEIFVVIEWSPADNKQAHKHILVGRDVSGLIETISHRVPVSAGSHNTGDSNDIFQMIEELPILTIEYHPSEMWKFYVKRKVVV